MAERIDLYAIKKAIHDILVAANDQAANPNLSYGLANNRRVKKIYMVQPANIPIQGSHYPYVTCYVTKKSMAQNDIASNQMQALKRAVIGLEIVGAVWNQNISEQNEDPADNDCNQLLENIELILRGNDKLNNTVKWHQTVGVQYYTVRDSNNHLRAGVLALEATVYY